MSAGTGFGNLNEMPGGIAIIRATPERLWVATPERFDLGVCGWLLFSAGIGFVLKFVDIAIVAS